MRLSFLSKEERPLQKRAVCPGCAPTALLLRGHRPHAAGPAAWGQAGPARLAAQRGPRGPGSCSAALRVFDKLSWTLSLQSVSLSNTPSEAPAKQRSGTPRDRLLPPCVLLLSETPRGIEQPVPWSPRPEGSCGLPAPALGCLCSWQSWYRLSALGRQRLGPGSVPFAAKDSAVLFHSIN